METADPIVVEAVDQVRFNPALADGGLLPLPGVQSFQVFRASKAVPEMCDDKGWTYNHHVDMACWKGRLYVGWNQCETDEDIWPSREVLSTSTDGIHWEKPREMFPQGSSVCLRMYFFLAPNGRMLVIAGVRVDEEKTNEDTKGGIIVREILADHSLGEIFTLQKTNNGFSRQPMFDTSSDAGFITACKSLLADTVYLEQQDRGMLLGPRRMKWHDAKNWPGGKVPGDNEKWVAGKAYSFFRRKDGTIVGISKMGWVTTTTDNGKNWAQPIDCATLVTGKAKVWCQELPNNRIALVYNPTERARFPLAIVTSDDGVHFKNMRIVQGELPLQRYEGDDRSVGPQYIRGISRWSDDGSRSTGPNREDCFWLVYSMSKEDIWVSRVPINVSTQTPDKVDDDFTRSGDLSGWNLYIPRWSELATGPAGLQISCRDPYDYARLDRIITARNRLCVRLELTPQLEENRVISIELLGEYGSPRPVQLLLQSSGTISSTDGHQTTTLGKVEKNTRITIETCADTRTSSFSVRLNNSPDATTLKFAEPSAAIHRLSIRTGMPRNLGGTNRIVPSTDKPTAPAAITIHKVSMEEF